MNAAAPLPCFHCGLPVPAGSSHRAAVLGEQRAFCCPGCQAVAETIAAGGLDGYYRQRSQAGTAPDALPKVLPDELALLDRDDVREAFVDRDEALARATLLLEGVTCAACGWLIEEHLARLEGVVEARLNLTQQRLHLRWDDRRLPLSRLVGELRRIGYAAHPYRPDQAAERLAAENRLALRRLGVAGLLWMQVMMAAMATWPEFNLDLSAGMDRILRWVSLFLTTPIVFYCCGPFFRGALRDLRTRSPTMDLSVALAIGLAYGAGLWSTLTGRGELYFDAVGMFALFLLTGRYLERRARERTAAATAQLVNLLPASCLRLQDGQPVRVLLAELAVGDRLQVPPGALVPADGRIVEGQSSLDEALLTGEYRPQPRGVGDAVTAGTLNVESPLLVEVTALGDDTRLSAIVRLLERAQTEKPRLAEAADRLSRGFLLATLLAALAVGLAWWQLAPERAFWVALSLLVATCPCALSLATPTALTAATGALHRLGLLITRGHVLEGLGQVDTVIFDKTGTLTAGRPTLREVRPLGVLDGDRCLALAAALESGSEHPLARAFPRPVRPAAQVEAVAGQGLQGQVEGRPLRIGNPGFVAALGGYPTPPAPDAHGQWLLLGDAAGPLAWLALDDALRDDAPALVGACRARGWRTLVMSGDPSPTVGEIASRLAIDEAHGGLSPAAKLARLQALQAEGRRVLVLGDGVNDAPLLAAADIGVAMGAGSDLSKTRADAVLLGDCLQALVTAFAVADRTRRVIRQNLAWAGLYNGLVLPLAALGWVTPLWAALGMSFSSLLVVLNAARLARPVQAR
jgi:Cu2+-exporting ATPase